MSAPRHQPNHPAHEALPGHPPKGAGTVQAPPSSVERALAGAGKPLEPAVREDMAPRFGCGFFDVHVHDDTLAAASARDLDARAYAAGPHIVFAAGRYAPDAHEGRRLLAHELAHVAQQQRGGPATKAEQRAEYAANEAVAGRPVDRQALGGAPVGIHAQPEDKAPTPARQADAPGEASETKEEEAGPGRSVRKILGGFALDDDTLTAGHLSAIEELALSIASQTGKATVEIVGHTDTSGTESHNSKLGLARANRVKEALQKRLAGEKGPPSVEWQAVRSAGESAPLVPTGDNTKEPRNRRVEVKVTIVPPPAAAAPQAAPSEPDKKKPIDLFPPDVLAPPQQEDIWKKMQENQRRIEELDRKIGKKPPRSAQDMLVEALAAPLDGLVNKLPISNSLKKKAREGIRDGIRAGSEKIAEAAIDAVGLPPQEVQALKAAVKAALKQKTGQTGGETP